MPLPVGTDRLVKRSTPSISKPIAADDLWAAIERIHPPGEASTRPLVECMPAACGMDAR